MKSVSVTLSLLKDVVVVHMGVYTKQFGYLRIAEKLLLRNCYHLIKRLENCHFPTSVFNVELYVLKIENFLHWK